MTILGDAFSTIGALLDKLSRRRIASLILILYLTFACLWTFETYTQYFNLQKLDHTVSILAQFRKLPGAVSPLVDSLAESTAIGVISELKSVSVSSRRPFKDVKEIALRMLAAGTPWIIVSLLLLPKAARSKGQHEQRVLDLLMSALAAGAIGGAIPMFGALINYVYIPISLFLLVMGYVWALSAPRRAHG